MKATSRSKLFCTVKVRLSVCFLTIAPLAVVATLLVACGNVKSTGTNPQASSRPAPTSTAVVSDASTWAELASLNEQNNEQYNSDFKSPYFVPKSRQLKVDWKASPLQGEYNWNIAVFRRGQNPNNSNGVAPVLMSDATYGTGTPDSGSETFKTKPGEQYYLWIEIWHNQMQVTLSESQ